jgi:hypothetical protein
VYACWLRSYTNTHRVPVSQQSQSLTQTKPEKPTPRAYQHIDQKANMAHVYQISSYQIETHSYRAFEPYRPTDRPILSSPSFQSSPVGFRRISKKTEKRNKDSSFFFQKENVRPTSTSVDSPNLQQSPAHSRKIKEGTPLMQVFRFS